MTIDIESLTLALDKIAETRAAELREIINAKDKTALACRAMMDDVFDAVGGYLCNYATATDHKGVDHEIVDVIQRVQEYMADEYQRSTGVRYRSRVERRCDETRWRLEAGG